MNGQPPNKMKYLPNMASNNETFYDCNMGLFTRNANTLVLPRYGWDVRVPHFFYNYRQSSARKNENWTDVRVDLVNMR